MCVILHSTVFRALITDFTPAVGVTSPNHRGSLHRHRKGRLDTQKITGVSVQGEILNLVNTINGMIDQLAMFSAEVTKVAREVGTEGKLGVQAEVGNVQGTWQEITYVIFRA